MWERTYTCNKIKIHRWCETQVLIGWNFLVSHHDIEYNFLLTPCYQSPLCFTGSILAYSSKTLHQSSNKGSVSMCCLLLRYSLEPRLNSRALCTAGSSVYDHRFINLKRMFVLWIPVWREKTRLTSSEVRGSVTLKAWRQFSSSLKMRNEVVCSIAFVINSVNDGRFLEFTELN